ncbi:hypothetical protein TCAL_16555 [Tigriopus californicus]|uniref:Uncharacterized protein n=1 Tax=Tigriopus californicus TaxID=6832 RepID=A0A553NBZ1_TIGCA|nr:hypothetical protein TCAL_16555 [Tigriopus californicus]
MALRLLKGEIEKAFQAGDGSSQSSGPNPPAASQLKLKERLPSDRRGLKKAYQRLRLSQHTSQKTISALKAPRFKLADPRQYSGTPASSSAAAASLESNVKRWLALSAHPVEAEVGRVVQKHNLQLKRAWTPTTPTEPTQSSSVFTEQDFEKWQAAPFLHSPLEPVTPPGPTRKKKKSASLA